MGGSGERQRKRKRGEKRERGVENNVGRCTQIESESETVRRRDKVGSRLTDSAANSLKTNLSGRRDKKKSCVVTSDFRGTSLEHVFKGAC